MTSPLTHNSRLDISMFHRCDENRRRIWKHPIRTSGLATLLRFLGRYHATLKIAGISLISSQREAGPYGSIGCCRHLAVANI